MQTKMTINSLNQLAKKYVDISNVAPLLIDLQRRNIKISDKLIESLVIGAKHANKLKYQKIYEENLLHGLIKSNSIITGFLDSIGVNLSDLLSNLDLGSEILEQKFINIRSISKNKNRIDKPYTYKRLEVSLGGNRNIDGKIKTDELFKNIINEPVVWKSFANIGVSVNKLHRYLKLVEIAEPNYDVQKLIMWNNGNRIKLDIFNLADLICIQEKDTIIFPYKLNLISTEKYFLYQQVEQLEWLINKDNTTEYDIQKFLENNPWFLLGIEYKSLHSQLILTREDIGNLKPDFMLERVDNGFVDIVELKRPQEKLVVGDSNRRTFSHAMMSALGQLREYRNYFEESANRKEFYGKYGLNAYKPKISVVIGRNVDFQSPMERINLIDEYKNLNLLTFDDLIIKAKSRLSIL